MTYETRLFINNEYVNSSSGETISVTNPATNELVTDQIQVASSEDVDKAVKAARAAFKTWRKTPSEKRAAIMLKYADLVEEHAEEWGRLQTTNVGAPSFVPSALIKVHAQCFRYYAGLVDKIHGETYNEDGDNLFKIISYEPLGVCAGISAWNGSPLSVGWKIAPAVAMGNTFVHKSSERDPLGCCFLGKLFKEAGFPPGVINMISGGGATGAAMASHPDINKIAFTGSIAAGRKVQIAAAQSNLKHVTLELGGKSPSIVFPDADIDKAITHNTMAFLANNAQACSAASRLFVHEDISKDFLEKLKASWTQASTLVGDPMTQGTFLGPMVDQAQVEHVKKFVDRAKKEGIEVLVSGEKIPEKGAYFPPTVFVNPPLESQIWKEEIFGPVLSVRTFKTEEEAIELANDTDYGLSAIIFTKDITRALKVAAELEVGTLSINGSHLMHKTTSWGGWKQSGYGRESGLEAIKEYVQSKSIHVHLGDVHL